MESPPRKTAVNLEDSGCVVDGLRSALSDEGDDESSMMVCHYIILLTIYFIGYFRLSFVYNCDHEEWKE